MCPWLNLARIVAAAAAHIALFSISIGLGTRVSLLHHGEVVNKLSSNLALVTNVGAAADVHFGQVPFEFCVTMQRDNARLRFAAISASDVAKFIAYFSYMSSKTGKKLMRNVSLKL